MIIPQSGSIMSQASLPLFATRVENGFELRLKIVPGARQTSLVGALGDRLKIRVAAPPEAGKANTAVLLVLSDWLHTEAITVIAGHHHPNKTVYVRGLTELPELPASR
jgi:uncharacterized protein